MKFGVSLWLWTSPVNNKTIEDFAPKIAKMGFDTIEVPLEDPDSLDFAAARKVIEDHGLSVTCCAAMGPGRDLVHPDIPVQNQTIEYLRKALEGAAEMGSDVLPGPVYAEVGRLWSMTSEERKIHNDLLAAQLSKVSEFANKVGVTICVEALNRFETSFLNLTSQVKHIVELVNEPTCKIGIDLFHAGIEEKSLADAIRLAGDDLVHLQVAENDRGTPGTGQFRWNEVAEALNEIGYNRHVVIETFSPGNELLAKAAAIWRPLSESPDQLATDGLQFLRQLLK